MLSRHVRKWHILDTLTFPQLGSSISSYGQKLSADLTKTSQQLRVSEVGNGEKRLVVSCSLKSLICKILLFMPHPMKTKFLFFSHSVSISYALKAHSAHLNRQTLILLIWSSKKAVWMQMHACLTSGSAHKKSFLESLSSCDSVPVQTLSWGFWEIRRLWKSWQHCSLIQMLTGNINNRNDLKTLECSAEVKPLERKMEVRMLKGLNSLGQHRVSTLVYCKRVSLTTLWLIHCK